MEVRTLVKKGDDHLTYCEDSLFFRVQDAKEPLYIGAIFDGCSTGMDSHFASSLLVKVLKHSCNNFKNVADLNLHFIMNILFHDIFDGFKEVQHLLDLKELELVSTMIICIIRGDEVLILSSGDGVIKVDDELIILESKDNAPDYMAYYLDKNPTLVMAKHTNLHSFTFKKDVSICSDGICSFRNALKEDATALAIDTFLNDRSLIGSDAMLSRKYNIFRKKGYINFDDISIVRFIKEPTDESI
jgi:hypothetical protein